MNQAPQNSPPIPEFSFLVQVLWLLSFDDDKNTLADAVDKYCIGVPPIQWLSWIPQLLTCLVGSEGKLLLNLISQVGRSLCFCHQKGSRFPALRDGRHTATSVKFCRTGYMWLGIIAQRFNLRQAYEKNMPGVRASSEHRDIKMMFLCLNMLSHRMQIHVCVSSASSHSLGSCWIIVIADS